MTDYLADHEETTDHPIDVLVKFRKDNHVMPVAFWTPDDVKVRIDKVLDKQDAATFKTKGIGDRYKIQAANAITYLFRIGDLWYLGHPGDDLRIPGIHTRYTGAYYGGKKIIDDRYDNPLKVPVDVSAICYAIGDVVPGAFWWPDGTRYVIDSVKEWERAASVRAGIIGIRYSIRIRDRETFLYRDDDLWFMERRDTGKVRILDVHGRDIGL